ncbi:MAG: superfamily II DNA or RNA helicase, partial [Paracoccaceae bacterium]
EAAFRGTPPLSEEPLTLGKAAIDDLTFQHAPVRLSLKQPRLRLLIADDVGLGKTLEAGLIAAEQILRGRARRILVVSSRAMLNQFQKEFWTRFSIPLARLDSAAIRRMKNALPAHYNVFDQFERVIVSIDTLKRDLQYREALEDSHWDLVIIDEAHNAAERTKSGASGSLRARLARLLSRKADGLLLLTATPHDGSQDSFASLIRMLDPARAPRDVELHRDDIEDLVVRRFRHSTEVAEALSRHVPARSLERHSFPLNAEEEEAYSQIAGLSLSGGEGGRGADLFRVTLAKSMFSSPAACFETVKSRLRRKQHEDSEDDRATLSCLAEAVLPLLKEDKFSKYQRLLHLLKTWRWTGKDKRDRIVIFSERIATLDWLREHLAKDLRLPPEAIGGVHGGGIEADERTQKVLEDFGQEQAPIRILLASDMASEGLNLHFHCHRLVHFDLPWSLLRFQQRNGRIDRYGQEHAPEIHYFVGESVQPKIRDMWVLDKLVEKDEAAQKGLKDPAVFLGVGDPEKEESKLLEFVARGGTAKSLETEMNANAAAAAEDLFNILFSEFTSTPELVALHEAAGGPRLFPDAFAYAASILERMNDGGAAIHSLHIDRKMRVIEFDLPETMQATGDFGYSRKGEVDDKFMPREALRNSRRIELTDDRKVVDNAIAQARFDEHAWPRVQYLWEVHPIMDWLNDAAKQFFPRRTAPLCRLQDALREDEVAVLLHGAAPDRLGRTVGDLWRVLWLAPETSFALGDQSGWRVKSDEDPTEFFARTGFDNRPVNAGDAMPGKASGALPVAVARFQELLIARRKEASDGLQTLRRSEEDRLAVDRARFDIALQKEFESLMSDSQRLADTRRNERQNEVDALFGDWRRWIDDRCSVVEDPHPHVDVVAVFHG